MLCILLTILQCLSHSPKFLCAYLTGYQGKTFLRQALLPDFDIALQTLLSTNRPLAQRGHMTNASFKQ